MQDVTTLYVWHLLYIVIYMWYQSMHNACQTVFAVVTNTYNTHLLCFIVQQCHCNEPVQLYATVFSVTFPWQGLTWRLSELVCCCLTSQFIPCISHALLRWVGVYGYRQCRLMPQCFLIFTTSWWGIEVWNIRAKHINNKYYILNVVLLHKW